MLNLKSSNISFVKYSTYTVPLISTPGSLNRWLMMVSWPSKFELCFCHSFLLITCRRCLFPFLPAITWPTKSLSIFTAAVYWLCWLFSSILVLNLWPTAQSYQSMHVHMVAKNNTVIPPISSKITDFVRHLPVFRKNFSQEIPI